MPYLDDIQSRTGPDGTPERTPEEKQYLAAMERLRKLEGEPPMTVQEENFMIAQARMIGDL